jgi:hypothetical protein
MEKEEKRILEVFLGLTLIVFLVLLAFLVTGVSASQESSTTISHSYNVNSYNNQAPSYTYPIKSYVTSRPTYPYTLDLRKTYYVDEKVPIRYYDRGEYKRVSGILGNEVDKYAVYVRNDDYVGGYFKVRFYFSDYYGRTSTESVRYYIPPQQEKTFRYHDISGDRYTHHVWRYEVIPETEVPAKIYYYEDRPTAPYYYKTSPGIVYLK